MIGCLVVSFTIQSNCAAFVLGLFWNHSCSCHLSLDALASVTVYLVLLSQCLYWRVHGKWVLDVDACLCGVCSSPVCGVGRLSLDFRRWMLGLGVSHVCFGVAHFNFCLVSGRQWRWRFGFWAFGFSCVCGSIFLSISR